MARSLPVWLRNLFRPRRVAAGQSCPLPAGISVVKIAAGGPRTPALPGTTLWTDPRNWSCGRSAPVAPAEEGWREPENDVGGRC